LHTPLLIFELPFSEFLRSAENQLINKSSLCDVTAWGNEN